jgi:hypothetical protein
VAQVVLRCQRRPFKVTPGAISRAATPPAALANGRGLPDVSACRGTCKEKYSADAVTPETQSLDANWPLFPQDNRRRIVDTCVEMLPVGKDDFEISFPAWLSALLTT